MHEPKPGYTFDGEISYSQEVDPILQEGYDAFVLAREIRLTAVKPNWRGPVDDYFEQDMTEDIYGEV